MIKQAALTLYGWLLWLYPPDFRAEFGNEMKSVFADRVAERVTTFGITWAMLRELIDLLPSVVAAYSIRFRVGGGLRGRLAWLRGSMQPTSWGLILLTLLACLPVLSISLRMYYRYQWMVDPTYEGTGEIRMMPGEDIPYVDFPMVLRYPAESEVLTWALVVTAVIAGLATLFVLIRRRSIEPWSFVALGLGALGAAVGALSLPGLLMSPSLSGWLQLVVGVVVLIVMVAPGLITLLLIQRSQPLPARAWGVLAIIPAAICCAIPEFISGNSVSIPPIRDPFLNIAFGLVTYLIFPSIFLTVTVLSLRIGRKHGPAAALLVMPMLALLSSEMTRSSSHAMDREYGVAPVLLVLVILMSLMLPTVLVLRATSREGQTAGLILPILMTLGFILVIPDWDSYFGGLGLRLWDWGLDAVLYRLYTLVPSVTAVVAMILFYEPNRGKAVTAAVDAEMMRAAEQV